MSNLKLDTVGKTYAGGVSAVANASFDVADGEFIVLVGPSGCGKSTMLRMIAGLEEISEGSVSIGGRVVNDVEPGARDIAMVFQNYALYPHMTVRDNMAYGLKNQGMKRAEIDARIAEAARFLQLELYLNRRPKALSGGQRQRVAMGRAIVREPAVFLFDEPLSNLDAKLRTQLRAELKDLHKRLGATFIYVTHDQIEAMSLADRIVIMNGGRIEQIGTPMELYANPASTFVAEFIGAPPMNVLPIKSPAAQGFLGREPQAVQDAGFIGIRPEALSIADTGATARILLVEALGAESLIHLELGGDRMIMRSGDGLLPEVGTEVCVAAKPDSLRFFDGAGKARGAVRAVA